VFVLAGRERVNLETNMMSGADAFGRDGELPERVFAEQSDNCVDKLHAARCVEINILMIFSFVQLFSALENSF
jgi:hypothetical protein